MLTRTGDFLHVVGQADDGNQHIADCSAGTIVTELPSESNEQRQIRPRQENATNLPVIIVAQAHHASSDDNASISPSHAKTRHATRDAWQRKNFQAVHSGAVTQLANLSAQHTETHTHTCTHRKTKTKNLAIIVVSRTEQLICAAKATVCRVGSTRRQHYCRFTGLSSPSRRVCGAIDTKISTRRQGTGDCVDGRLLAAREATRFERAADRNLVVRARNLPSEQNLDAREYRKNSFDR